MTVRLLNGTSETVRVQQLPVNKIPALMALMDDECAMVELYCGKEQGWAATLFPEDYEKVIVEAEALNADFFTHWVQRRLARMEKASPGFMGKLADGILPSLISLPKSR